MREAVSHGKRKVAGPLEPILCIEKKSPRLLKIYHFSMKKLVFERRFLNKLIYESPSNEYFIKFLWRKIVIIPTEKQE